MMFLPPGSDAQPLFRVNGWPVRLHTLLVIIHVAALVAACIAGVAAWGIHTAFIVPAEGWSFLKEPWRAVTYVFFHAPTVWFAIEMLWLWQWARILEESFGRRLLLRLYLGLVLAAPLLLCLAHLLPPFTGYVLAGSHIVHFCLFLAVAFLMPGAQTCFFGISDKWLAVALSAIFLLQFVAARDGAGAVLGISSGILTYAYLRLAGLEPRFRAVGDAFREALPRFGPRRPPQGGRSRPAGSAQATPARYEPKIVPRSAIAEDPPEAERINAVLDKIASDGIESLTADERAILERASARLKRDQS